MDHQQCCFSVFLFVNKSFSLPKSLLSTGFTGSVSTKTSFSVLECQLDGRSIEMGILWIFFACGFHLPPRVLFSGRVDVRRRIDVEKVNPGLCSF
ncbi:hypothetical protein V6N11_050690 [Hibiscus sabdariffa]|uniref:Uncharacterized protein n=1 Tax=Hibiscus sabdariffa TaxID=183260 RepID=A0ABR2TAQ2_9ROSI